MCECDKKGIERSHFQHPIIMMMARAPQTSRFGDDDVASNVAFLALLDPAKNKKESTKGAWMEDSRFGA